MNEKIKVPEGMIEAAHKASEFTDYEREKRTLRFAPGIINTILEAALVWLTEHPIVPTDEQMNTAYFEVYKCRLSEASDREKVAKFVADLQRHIFDAPEPEVPHLTETEIDLAALGYIADINGGMDIKAAIGKTLRRFLRNREEFRPKHPRTFNAECPEEIKDMLLDARAPDSEHSFFKPSVYNERITEAYRRGKESRKP